MYKFFVIQQVHAAWPQVTVNHPGGVCAVLIM